MAAPNRRRRRPLTERQKRRSELMRLRRAITKRHRRQVRQVRKAERRAATRQIQKARRAAKMRESGERKRRQKQLTKLRRRIRKRYADADRRQRRKGRKAEARARKRVREKMLRVARRTARKLRNAEQRARRKEHSKQARAQSRADQAYHRASAKVTSQQIKERGGIIADAIRRIGSLRGTVVSAGFTGDPGKATHGAAGTTVAAVAYANEYGIGAPERPFMRITNARERRNWINAAAKIVQGQARGAEAQARGVRRLGLLMVSGFKDTIREGVSPPNSPETIAHKGSSKTLVDTGQMINSIRADMQLPSGFRELIA